MGKPLSRPGCFRKSSCCLDKHGAGDGRVGGRDVGVEGGYGDGYIPQRSIYDTMCINQQIDSHHHHHPGGSIRRDGGMEGSLSYSASGSLRVCRSPADMFDPQPRSLTPNPSFVRRLDERAIYDSLKLGGQDVVGSGFHSPDDFARSVSPAVSSFSAPGISYSSKKHHHHHHHHHHGDSIKSRDGRHSCKVMTPQQPMECLELTTNEMMDRGGGYLNPGHYAHPGGQTSSLTSPLISPFSGSPISSGYHTPVFFSPAKSRPSQSQSLRCSPPHAIQQRHYSQTQSLRLSPPQELRRSPYRAPLVQLSAHDLEQDLRDRGGGLFRNEREREWERERERELERGWAQREWERERERGRLERERARERERRETSFFGTFGYGRPVPLHSERDSVFLDTDQGLDTTPLLLPQPSPSPSPNNAPRMGTCAVGRNRAGSRVGLESTSGVMSSKYDNGKVGMTIVDSTSGYGPRLVSESGVVNMSEAEMRAAIHEYHRAESRNKYERGSRASVKNGSEIRMGPQVKTRPGGRDLEGKVQSGVEEENMVVSVNEGHGGTRSGEKTGKGFAKTESIVEPTKPLTLVDTEDMVGPINEFESEAGFDTGIKPEIQAGVKAKMSSAQVENVAITEVGIVSKPNNDVCPAAESYIDAKVDPEAIMTSKPMAENDGSIQNMTVEVQKSSHNAEAELVSEAQKSILIEEAITEQVVEIAPADQAGKKPLDIDKSESHHTKKASKSKKSKSSKSCSRSRPGTATGMRPGAASPKIRLEDLESSGPPEGIEFTWPRRIMVRKRTVRQGGALHNLPILPPLPSVLSALEKRRPQALLHLQSGHFSEKTPTGMVSVSSIVGRCSLKESANQESALIAGLVGRASLKEQNLEHWRICRDQEEHRSSRSKEKNEVQSEKVQRNEQTSEQEKREKQGTEDRDHKHDVVEDKENIPVCEGPIEGSKQEMRKIEGKVQEMADESKMVAVEAEIQPKMLKSRFGDLKDGKQEQHEHDEIEVVTLQSEEGEVDGGDGWTLVDQAGMESWDTVLGMVNTLWDEGWEKGGARSEGDTDSLSGSLQRWPLLRPPVGFGGSHPPSSAASELSLTELEKRARELDSDLEHLDLSQPQRDAQDLYNPLLEPQRDRADMYQTHPGPQREKAALLAGVGSRSQVSLELTAVSSPATAPDRPSIHWSNQGTGTSTVGTSSNKEDSSPESNITLESDSSGVFLSLSNQSQEDAGSDSDQPVSGSDLGSSTSLEKDGDDSGLKEWGREESAELQWCYPSLLETSVQEDNGFDEREQTDLGITIEGDEEGGGDADGRTDGKVGVVSIIQSSINLTEVYPPLFDQQSKEIPARKRVALREDESSFSVSPSKPTVRHLFDPNQKPIRSSGLDCGDIDPFAQSDSFVYLAVSAGPDSQGEVAAVTEVTSVGAKQDLIQTRLDDAAPHVGSMTTHLDPANLEQTAKLTQFTPQKPEEGDFLCTDSFVYLAAPACLLLGPPGTAPYSGRDSDSESSDSGPVDVSVLGCDSVAGDSDWDSDLSDSDPSRSTRTSAAANKSAGGSRPNRPAAEPDWDLFGDEAEPEVLDEPFVEQDRNNNGKARTVTAVTTCMAATPGIAMATQPPATLTAKSSTTAEPPCTTKKVTWQFKPTQRSVCTGSRKDKEKDMTSSSSSSSFVRFTEMGEGDSPGCPHSPLSSSSSSPSSSSSG